MIDDHRTLPGNPRKSKVIAVRRALNHYGIRPTGGRAFRLNEIWRDAWTWAVACSTWRGGKRDWPTDTEIASQYIFLLLMEMRNSSQLQLPYAARSERGGKLPAPLIETYLPMATTQQPLLAIEG
jgi:hypothetical protein